MILLGHLTIKGLMKALMPSPCAESVSTRKASGKKTQVSL